MRLSDDAITVHRLQGANIDDVSVYLDRPRLLRLEDLSVVFCRMGKEDALAFQQRCITNACLSTRPGKRRQDCSPLDNRTKSGHPALFFKSSTKKRSFPWQDEQTDVNAYLQTYCSKRHKTTDVLFPKQNMSSETDSWKEYVRGYFYPYIEKMNAYVPVYKRFADGRYRLMCP